MRKLIYIFTLCLLSSCFTTEECGTVAALYRNSDAMGATAYSLEIEGRDSPVLIPGSEARRIAVGDSVCFSVPNGRIGVDSLRIIE